MKPTLEEVKEYFKDAELVESIYGIRGVPAGNFHFEDDCYFCKHKGGHLALWKEDLGYAKILTYKEQKFEITKEQILELAKDAHPSMVGQLKEWFPEVFKKELEVNKWYKAKSTSYEYLLLYSGKNMSYGFADGVWGNWSFTKGANQELAIEATPKEVEAALIREAKKRYKIGTHFLDVEYEDKSVCMDKIKICNSCNELALQFGDGNGMIYHNGKWATIIETITIQEAEKLLKEQGINKKIV